MQNVFQTAINNCNTIIAGHTAQIDSYSGMLRGQQWIVAGDNRRVLFGAHTNPSVGPHMSTDNICGVIAFDRETAERYADMFSTATGETLIAVQDIEWHRAQIQQAHNMLAMLNNLVAA